MAHLPGASARTGFGIGIGFRAEREDEALDRYYDQSSRVQQVLAHREDSHTFELYQSADRTYAGYGNLFRALAALATFLEDVRFVLSDWSEEWIGEYEITGGRLRVTRGFCEEDLDYWSERVVRSPDDLSLRHFAVQSHLVEVQQLLRELDRLTGQPRALAIAHLGAVLDRAAALDDSDADLWHARGRLDRAAGALDEADRAFARASALAPARAAAAQLEQALVAFTAGDAPSPAPEWSELWPEGRSELATEPDLAPLREAPGFRALVAEPT